MSTCGACGGQIAEPEATPTAERLQCPACGSTSRRLERSAEDRLPFLRSSLQIKVVRGATGEVAQEQFVGADQTVADGTWTDKAMVRDYENDRYAERLVREGDGVVVRDADEPLSEHRGRGSDRPDRRAARAAIKAQQQAERAARKALRDEEWRASQRARDLDRS